jgi:methionyl-tRNA formyltransferase
MNKVILFLLGLKGFQVARACLIPKWIDLIETVVIGKDSNVEDDYSNQIRELCQEAAMTWVYKNDFRLEKNRVQNLTAIAAGWRWLITDTYKQIIVFHDSLLPKYRGFNPLVTALLAREKYIGVTAIIANKDFDKGDIIQNKTIAVEYPITINNAIARVSELYHDLANEIIPSLYHEHEFNFTVQNEDAATYSVWRDDEDYNINWNLTSNDIAHFIRCVGFPYKGASTTLDGQLIRIIEANTFPDVNIINRHPGKVLFIENEKPIIICGEGLLIIKRAQYEDGSNALPFQRFRIRLK